MKSIGHPGRPDRQKAKSAVCRLPLYYIDQQDRFLERDTHER